MWEIKICQNCSMNYEQVSPGFAKAQWQVSVRSGVTRLQWAHVQVFQKGPLFPKKT